MQTEILQQSSAAADQPVEIAVRPRREGREPLSDQIGSNLGRHWLHYALAGLGIFITLPWIAPVTAALGWWWVADRIYGVYMFVCHQLPERAAWIFGYQVAYCWRDTALYTGMFVFGALYALARGGRVRRLSWLPRSIPLWGFLLLLVPMALDGFSHMFGLRDNPALAPSFGSFLVGSQLGSLNWVLRIMTGLLAALGAVWFTLPRMNKAMEESEALRLAYAQARTARILVASPTQGEGSTVQGFSAPAERESLATQAAPAHQANACRELRYE